MTNNRLRDLPKSRALTTGFKLFSGLALFALAAAFLTGFQTCRPDWVGWEYPPIQCTGDQGLIDSLSGPLTLGWKGGVGNHFAFALFVAFAVTALFMAGLMTAYRDADPKAVAEAARTEVPPPARPPQNVSYWPILAAFSTTLVAVGLVVNSALFVAGVAGIGLCVVMWTLRTWAEDATGDPEVNEEIHERIAFGLEVPLVAVVILGAVTVSVSRVLLAVDATAAVAVAAVVAALVFGLGVLVAYIPRIGKNAVTIFLLAAALLVIGAGVISAAVGERDFEQHESETHEESGAEAEVDN
jgi:hypothetical protein